MNVDEYSSCEPDAIVMTNPNRTLQVLNERYSGEAGGLPVPVR